MIQVTSFYKFFSIKKEQLASYQKQLRNQAQKKGIKGLIILGEEGINSTLCGLKQDILNMKKDIQNICHQDFFWKDSYCDTWNFKRLSVKIKKEIITINASKKPKENNHYLSPQEWETKIKTDVQIIDIRNNYEVNLGRFKGAKHLNMDSFQEFYDKLPSLNLDKNKDTLIYCTGGIRCEKAIEIMKDKKFKHIYQLYGGILHYLKHFPNGSFQNECFVFDHRTAVDNKLQVSKKYSLCPHCGQPGDIKIFCKHCNKPCCICTICKTTNHFHTCSKNCSHHFKHAHKCYKPYTIKKTLKNL